MSHGWRGLVCRSACKPHFHLPIFTFLRYSKSLVLYTVNCLTAGGIWWIMSTKHLDKIWVSPHGIPAVEKSLQKWETEGKKIKQPSHMAYCGMVRWVVGWRGGVLYIMYNVDGLKDFPKMLSWIKIPAVFWSCCFFPPLLLYSRTLMHAAFWILHYVGGRQG